MAYDNILWNDGWQFNLQEVGSFTAKTIVTNENWHEVEIPHDWLIYDTNNLYKSGEGWYRKSFELTEEDITGVIYINFDGVYMNSTVYVNGENAGDWNYGYSPFSFNITPFVKAGKNEIVVQVRHEAPNSRWYSGAGIYRNVFLKKRNKNYIALDGVYISPLKSNNKWTIRIDTEVLGGNVITHTVLSADGSVFAKVEGDVVESVTKIELAAENPKLWNLNEPNLYTLKTELYDENGLCDTVFSKFGFRTIEFDPQNGFFLNGKYEKLHGVCMHHDLGALGAASNYRALERQLEILKSFGTNAVRTSHNMPSSDLVELCDKMGVLINSESYDMWENPKREFDNARFFPNTYKKDVAAWVRRDRNNPSVIMWSVGNEIADTHMSERGLEVTKNLCEEVHRWDYYGNAKCTIGSNYMPWENAQKVADYIKLAGYNYAENLYDEHHAAHPDWFIYGSETASAVRSRGIYHMPLAASILTHDDMQCSDLGNSVVGWGSTMEKSWIMDRDRAYCGGQFIWSGFDYIGEPTPYSSKNSFFGIIDTAGLPKASYYFYKAVWTDGDKEPFIHIIPYWDWNEGEDVDIVAYSNVEDVELFLNGVSLGKQHIDLAHGNILHGEWKAAYTKGELMAKAYRNGAVVAVHTVSSFGESDKLVFDCDKTELKADGRDLAFITISASDKNGNEVMNARNRIKIDVNGPGRLVGLDNGDSTDYDGFKSDSRRLFSGKLVAIIQSTLEAGRIEVSVSSEGLPNEKLELTAITCEKPQGISVADARNAFCRQESKSGIPARKIELTADRTTLDNENKTATIKAKILPENSDSGNIIWKCVLPNGVTTPVADVKGDNTSAVVTVKGNGEFLLRAMCPNSSEKAEIFSDIKFKAIGLGDALMSAYGFISASFYSFSNKQLRVVERGAISGISDRTVIGFDNIDFGSHISDTLRLYLGNCSDSPIKVEVWLGNPDKPDEKTEKITDIEFPVNSLWDGFAPFDFTLPKRLKGLQSIAFVVDKHNIFGGFEFVPQNRAFAKLTAAECDAVYGDDFEINGSRIEKIGNNVVIEFKEMDFGDGTVEIAIRGRTKNVKNTIQIRYTPSEGGEQKTQLIEFSGNEYTDKYSLIDRISGKQDISFVFLPGSNFDFDWFWFK